MEKTSIRKTEYFFYGFYLILTIAKGMGLYEGMRIFNALVCIAFLFLFIKLAQEHYTLQQLTLTVFVLGLGLVTWRVSGKMGALFNLTLLVGLRNVNHRRLIQISSAAWGIIFLLQCFLTMSGLRTQQIFRIHRKLGIYIVRWSMGFTHPNVLHITYFILVVLAFYAVRPKRKKRLLRYSMLAMIGNVVLFCYSVSYTGVLIVTLYLAVNVVLQSKVCQQRYLFVICKYLAYSLPILCVMFSAGAPLLLKGQAFEFANRLLSTRLELSRQYIMGQGIHLFGNSNMEITDASITVDSSYVYMLVHYGLIYFVFFCVLLEAAVIYCWKRKKMDAVAILVACAVSGVTEQYMANTSFKNVAVLIIAVMFYDNLIWERTGTVSTCYLPRLQVLQFVSEQRGIGYRFKGKRISVFLKHCLEEGRTHFFENKKKLLGMSVAAFCLGVAQYCITVHMPSALYASLWDCDRKEGAAGYEYIYDKDLLNDPDFDGWILSDKDSQGRLYGFDGLTVTSEYYRRAAGRGFSLVILMLWIEGGITVFCQKERK